MVSCDFDFCPLQHDHPYISAMVNNGSLHYDHDRDGTHSQVSGCTVSQGWVKLELLWMFAWLLCSATSETPDTTLMLLYLTSTEKLWWVQKKKKNGCRCSIYLPATVICPAHSLQPVAAIFIQPIFWPGNCYFQALFLYPWTNSVAVQSNLENSAYLGCSFNLLIFHLLLLYPLLPFLLFTGNDQYRWSRERVENMFQCQWRRSSNWLLLWNYSCYWGLGRYGLCGHNFWPFCPPLSGLVTIDTVVWLFFMDK